MGLQALGIEGFSGMNQMRKIGTATPRSYFNMPKTYLDGMWIMQNCYITTGHSIRKRPCMKYQGSVAGSAGLFAANGVINVFYTTTAPTLPSGYVAHKIPNPNAPTTSQIVKINFATVFLGQIFVVATYDDGTTHYFYLMENQAWTANTSFPLGTIISPSAAYKAAHGDPGFYYQVTTGPTLAEWTANALHAVGDIVVPTVANGFQYEVVSATGTPIQSGAIEPVWPTVVGETVTEVRDPTSQTAPTTYVPPTFTPLGPFWNNQFTPSGGYKTFRFAP